MYGVPSKNCPAIAAITTEPKVARALTTLAPVPAICPRGSIAKAVRFPKVRPAWKNMPKIQKTKMAKPTFPERKPLE